MRKGKQDSGNREPFGQAVSSEINALVRRGQRRELG